MGTKIPIILSDKYWVPKKYVDTSKLDGNFRHLFFDNKVCNTCEYQDDRPCEACQSCTAFGGDFRLYEPRVIGTNPYIGLPRGSKKKIAQVVPKFDKLKIKDKRIVAESLPKGIEFTGKLYDYQEEAVAELLKKFQGIIESAPRTGKTVLATAYALRRGKKVLIFAHQEDLLKQFQETLLSPEFTNIAHLQEVRKTQYVGIAKTYEDFKKLPIALTTYQTFLSKKGQKKLKRVIKLPFDSVVVDEVHRSGASGYSKVLTKFKTRARFGLTATPERKDKREVFPKAIIGPVVFRTGAKSMAPIIKVVETKLRITRNYKIWTYAMRALELLDGRDELIVKHVLRDLKKGHSICIPVTFTRHANNLVRKINQEYGSQVAVAFNGSLTKDRRREVILKARTSKKYRVVVAQRSMLTGVNIPRWSALYEIAPIANEPNLKQEVMRICTPMEHKLQPVIKFFVDDFGIGRACFRKCDASFKRFGKELGGFEYTSNSKKIRDKVLQTFYTTRAVRGGYGKKNADWKDRYEQSKYTPRRVSVGRSVLF